MISEVCEHETALETEMQTTRMIHPNPDMLLYIAIGDAVAAATEFVKPHEHPQLIANTLRLDGYYQHPTHLKLKPGMYTDDTQMSIGVVEVLLTPSGHLPNALEFAYAWTNAFHRDPRDGYARGFQAFLESHKTGETFLRDIRPDSDKNGACMRAVPIGAIGKKLDVLDVAKSQAKVTHNTPIGIFSAQIIALMSHFALHTNYPFRDMHTYLEMLLGRHMRTLNIDLRLRWHGPVKSPATNTVHAVFDLLTHCSTLSEVLRGAIQFGGDTDSVASIALGIASTRMPNDLPQILFDTLENGPYGRDYLKTLGAQLMDAYT